MRTIRLTTWIQAPVERCFRLSLSIELLVTAGEKVSSGVRAGLLCPNDMVTRSGRCFGLKFQHTDLIDAVRPYAFFSEVMVEGTFSRFEHEHHFAALNDGTRVRDDLRFSCRGPAGELVEVLLQRRLSELVKMRNRAIRKAAESAEWQRYLPARKPTVAETREKVLFRA